MLIFYEEGITKAVFIFYEQGITKAVFIFYELGITKFKLGVKDSRLKAKWKIRNDKKIPFPRQAERPSHCPLLWSWLSGDPGKNTFLKAAGGWKFNSFS